MYLQSQAKMINNRVNMLKNQEKKNLRKIKGGKKLVNNKILHLRQIVDYKVKQNELKNKLNKNKILKEEMGSGIE